MKKTAFAVIWPFLFFLFIKTSAQVQPATDRQVITVKGQVVHGSDQKPVPFAHIVNKSRYLGTISDTAGYFIIAMHKFDTLVISAIGFERQEYILPPFVSVSPYHTLVFIRARSYPIDEVEVFILGTWEQFSEKMEKLNLPETEDEKLRRELGETAREVALESYQIPTGISFSLPSRYDASLKKLREIEAMEQRQIALYRKYNREVIARSTGLQGEELDDFIVFCNQHAWFTPETPAYDIIYQIKIWYRQYRILKGRR